ncbi:hypothetical protein C7M61_004074 [Candidozyma pseudohaemuli]|uniref:Uncharacterized protein n=1 Tax=Candidozyma pseudohaemuli TaxID=418784 RepID=A0A2P7YJW7_9ASCO|nr:hypothetical protein C7M61_004074 [[Candida] pseudohaemulonii]PSK36252.1 hypothetical protein C7M61_004074 [[Candida] pseudohaemulonii]
MGLDPPFTSGSPQATSSVDPVKPRVIFSSNIPQKIADCVSEKRLFLGGSTSRLVDLAKDIGELDVILELNTLLLRNRYLTPSDLVRKNLVFVAKKKSSQNTPKPFLGFKGIWKSVFEMSSPSEVFVVTLRVSLKRLVVDLANVNDMIIILRHDELHGSILRDMDLLKSIKTYIRQRLLLELRSNSNITSDIADTNTILQDLPVNDSLPLMKDLHNQVEEFDSSLADLTLDSNTGMPLIEKQLVFEDFQDVSTSDEELKILYSDDSGRCTVDDEEDLHFSDGQPTNVLSPALLGELPTLREESPPLSSQTIQPSTPQKNPEFLSPRKILLEPQPRTPTRRPNVLQSPPELTVEHDFDSPRSASVPTDLSPIKPPAAPSLMKHTSMSTLQPTLKKKSSASSFTMVSHDESHGLEYAFRDKSPTVPTYIRRDKKFKFIKVGKVQKFVNLFEEQGPGSESSTRNSTRPGSPLKGPKF